MLNRLPAPASAVVAAGFEGVVDAFNTYTAELPRYWLLGSWRQRMAAEGLGRAGLRLERAGEPIRVVEIDPGLVWTDGFSLTRFHGDQARADAVYAGVDRPLVAADVAECIAFCVRLPQHVNIDRLVVKPVAQAAPHKVVRAPIDWDHRGSA